MLGRLGIVPFDHSLLLPICCGSHPTRACAPAVPPTTEAKTTAQKAVEEVAAKIKALPAGKPDAALEKQLKDVQEKLITAKMTEVSALAAVSATREPARCLTLEIKVAYHAALTDQVGPVHARGRVLKIGRRTAFTEARLVTVSDRPSAAIARL